MAEDLEEASNELIVTDEDAVRYGVGETFVLVENDDAEAMLEKALEETKAEVDALETEKRELQSAMTDVMALAKRNAALERELAKAIAYEPG